MAYKVCLGSRTITQIIDGMKPVPSFSPLPLGEERGRVRGKIFCFSLRLNIAAAG
jgi:hypothetical protein